MTSSTQPTKFEWESSSNPGGLHPGGGTAGDDDPSSTASWGYLASSSSGIGNLSSTLPASTVYGSVTISTTAEAIKFYQVEQLTYLWIVFVCIVVGNATVLGTLLLSKGHKSRMNFFIKHLAAADLCVGLLQVLPDIIWRTTISWYNSEVLCKLIKFMQCVVTYSSTYVLVALSIDRYDAITHPMNFSGSWKRARILVASAWGLSLLFSLPNLIFFFIKEHEVFGIQCWMEFGEGNNDKWIWQVYITSVAVTLFFVPAILISACYIIIVATIWRKGKAMNNAYSSSNADQPAAANSTVQTSSTVDEQAESRRASSRGLIPKAKVKTVKMTFVIIFVFILCWSPYMIYDLLQIPTSGPLYKVPRGGLIVPQQKIPGGGGSAAAPGGRRHSVISSSKEITSFPLKPGGFAHAKNGSMGGSGDIRRPSEVWLADPEGPGFCAMVLTGLALLLVIITLPFSLCTCIKVVAEYERSVIFRLGRLRKGGAKGPGIFFIIPCTDSYQKVDLRTVSFDVPPQEVLSRDSVTVSVDAVVYYRVSNPTMATNNIEDYSHSTRLLAATTLRNVLGTKNLAEILSERETISHVMQNSLDDATDPWGVKVERVEIKDVRLPVQLQRAMAAEAEAAREARAKVIAAEGEQKASRALREAAETIADSHSALQLRYLQTLNSISAEKNSTIIFPFPMELISQWSLKNDSMAASPVRVASTASTVSTMARVKESL